MKKFLISLFIPIVLLVLSAEPQTAFSRVPGIEISGLPNASPNTIENGDYLPLLRNGVTYKGTPWAFPAAGNIVLSGTTGVSPNGLSPTNGDCAVGSSGMWAVMPCITYTTGGLVPLEGVQAVGTTFTIASGCGTGGSAPTSLTGGVATGSFVANVTACSPVLSFPTAIHGWWCSMHDVTNSGDTFTQTATSSTSCTMTVASAVSTSDVIIFHAEAY